MMRQIGRISLLFLTCLGFVFLAQALNAGSVRSAPAANPVVPGAIRADATFNHIGVVWSINGDDNHNSRLVLEYRKLGESVWRVGAPAMRAYPTLIVDGSPLGLNYWAASAMFLESGQGYDLRLTLNDPDGGGAVQTLSANTRTALSADPAGRQLYVAPGSGGGSGSQADPFKGLQTAANAAQPGDTFHVAEGVYTPFQLLASGTPGHPIVFSGTFDGFSVVEGAGTTRGIITLGEYNQTIAYVIVEGLALRNGAWGIDAQHSHDILISHNTITDVDNGILNRRGDNLEYNQTIADNLILGRTPWPGTGIPSPEGIDLRGMGNVVAYNRVQNFSDCISVNPFTGPSYGNDVYGNDVSYCVDDGIEIDDNQANTRVWRNRVMNSRMGVSVQPVRGGPAYIFRNEFFNLESNPIKMHNQTTGFLVVHNSGAKNGNGQGDDGSMWRNAVFRSNLFLGTAYAFEFTTIADSGFRDFDYNAWGTTRSIGSPSDPYFKWNNVRYSRLPNLQAIGVEVHGIPAQFSHLVNAALPPSWDVAVAPGSRDLRLAAGAPQVNAGLVLHNLNDPFVADGLPDLGAFEAGQPLPVYGPRPAVPDLSLSSKQVSWPAAVPGQLLTYTILLRNAGSPAQAAQLSDVLPPQINYAGGLSASTGNAGFAGGVVTWFGSLETLGQVLITFDVVVAAQVTAAQVVVNTAVLDDGHGGLLERQAAFVANGRLIFLPVVSR